MERLRGRDRHRIDYRHLIHALLRKPGAFERYVYREALFPTVVFRKAYDALVESSVRWADLEYLRILYLAATTIESEVEQALGTLLNRGLRPDYEAVKRLSSVSGPSAYPELTLPEPDLGCYDALLGAAEVIL